MGDEVYEKETNCVVLHYRHGAVISSCKSYSYDEIARDPDSYYMKPCVFTGKVVQVMEDGDDSALRVT